MWGIVSAEQSADDIKKTTSINVEGIKIKKN